MSQVADLSAFDDDQLGARIEAQQETVRLVEESFIPLRKQYEEVRRLLRTLEGERERRRLAAEGREGDFRPAPRRSYTVADAIEGRESRAPLERPLAELVFLSMRRQRIILHPEGGRSEQRVTFYRDGVDAEPATAARTLGEAKALHAAGWLPGVSGVPLNRVAVYYEETRATGWLRLDQMYVEEHL